MPMAAVLSINAANPVVDPSAAMSKVVPGCCDLNSSASCGTSFAPRVSEPLMTNESPRATSVAVAKVINVRTNFFILFHGNKADLSNDLLSASAEREIDKLFGQSARFAVGVIKCRSPVGIGMVLD